MNYGDVLRADREVYGAYNCQLNAILLWMQTAGIPTDRLYEYNFNINMGRDAYYFGGNAPLTGLLAFLSRAYGVGIQACEIPRIPRNETVILPIDAYELAYIDQVPQPGVQIHYVPAVRLPNNDFEIYDPYYKLTHRIEPAVALKSCERFGLPAQAIYSVQPRSGPESRHFPPYILEESDYRLKYRSFCEELQRIIIGYRQAEDGNAVYNRYFGCLKSLSLIRDKHFERSRHSEFHEEITGGWKTVTKRWVRLSMARSDADIRLLLDAIQNVLTAELIYLEQSGRQGDREVKG